jgi:hypothetical protein
LAGIHVCFSMWRLEREEKREQWFSFSEGFGKEEEDKWGSGCVLCWGATVVVAYFFNSCFAHEMQLEEKPVTMIFLQ